MHTKYSRAAMMRSFKALACLVTLVLSTGCSVLGVNSVEEASYRLLEKEGKFELREYESLVAAQTAVDADFKEAGSIAFRRLFDYISGNNESQQKVAMTAPVVAEAGEKIEMTAPVIGEPVFGEPNGAEPNGGEPDGNTWRYRFVLPKHYTIETAPTPRDDAVTLESVPQKTVAVIRFSGLVSREDVEEKTEELSRWMTANKLAPASGPRWAGYNPPWTLPFLRRNEVMIDVAPDA